MIAIDREGRFGRCSLCGNEVRLTALIEEQPCRHQLCIRCFTERGCRICNTNGAPVTFVYDRGKEKAHGF